MRCWSFNKEGLRCQKEVSEHADDEAMDRPPKHSFTVEWDDTDTLEPERIDVPVLSLHMREDVPTVQTLNAVPEALKHLDPDLIVNTGPGICCGCTEDQHFEIDPDDPDGETNGCLKHQCRTYVG